jgi:agmatinase
MKYADLYTHSALKLGGVEGNLDEAKYLVLGVPLDITSTYRPGSRFGPNAIREASLNLESYSLRSGLDVEDLGICDIGDLNVLGDLEGTLQRLRRVIGEALDSKKIPIALGGEHTLTYGCVKAFSEVAVLSFDAHMDLRDEYLGVKLSHATFMRRLQESLGADRIVEVGVRALCREELELAEKANLKYIKSADVIRRGSQWTVKEVKDALSSFERVYLTIDMDVLDPSYAPAVGNPVPEGLSPTILLDIIQPLCDRGIAGLDLVEVAPHYDSGVTAVQAAHIIFNVLAFLQCPASS